MTDWHRTARGAFRDWLDMCAWVRQDGWVRQGR